MHVGVHRPPLIPFVYADAAARKEGGEDATSARTDTTPSGSSRSASKRARQIAAGTPMAPSPAAAEQDGRATAPQGLKPEPRATLKTKARAGISLAR